MEEIIKTPTSADSANTYGASADSDPFADDHTTSDPYESAPSESDPSESTPSESARSESAGFEADAPETEKFGPVPPPPTVESQGVRRLYRTEGPVGGVAAGLADYFNVDPVLVRLGLVAGTLIGGPIVPIGYIAAWVIIPQANPAPVAPIMGNTSRNSAPASSDPMADPMAPVPVVPPMPAPMEDTLSAR